MRKYLIKFSICELGSGDNIALDETQALCTSYEEVLLEDSLQFNERNTKKLIKDLNFFFINLLNS